MMNFVKLLKNLTKVSLFFATLNSSGLFAMDGIPKHAEGVIPVDARTRFADIRPKFIDLKPIDTTPIVPVPSTAPAPTSPKPIDCSDFEELRKHEETMQQIAEEARHRKMAEDHQITAPERCSMQTEGAMIEQIIERTRGFDTEAERFQFANKVVHFLQRYITHPEVGQGNIPANFQVFENSDKSLNDVLCLITQIHTLGLGSLEVLLALVYMEKIFASRNICITKSNVFRLFLTSLIMATKYLSDYLETFTSMFKRLMIDPTFTINVYFESQLAFIEAINFVCCNPGTPAYSNATFHVTNEKILDVIHQLYAAPEATSTSVTGGPK